VKRFGEVVLKNTSAGRWFAEKEKPGPGLIFFMRTTEHIQCNKSVKKMK